MKFSPEYLAGFFDGEGYVYIHIGKRQQSCIAGIANTHFNVLKALQEEFGGSLYPKKRLSQKHSQGWELRWSGSGRVKRILGIMVPHLFVKKAEVEHLIKNWFPLIRKTGRSRGWSCEEKEMRVQVVSEFKSIRASERKVNQNELVN